MWRPFWKWWPLEIFIVRNKFRTSLSIHISTLYDIGQCWIFAVLWPPFWRWRSVEIFQFRESIRDIIIYPHIKFWWYRKMLNFFRPFLHWNFRAPDNFQVQRVITPYFWKWCVFAYFLCTVALSTSEKIAYMYTFKSMLDTSVIQ